MALDHFNPESQFADSDDEDEGRTKKSKTAAALVNSNQKGDEFAGSLKLKLGRNANTSLYFVEYSKLYNSGNGLLPQDKNDLLCAQQKAKSELDDLNSKEKNMKLDTKVLLKQPVNADTLDLLETKEAENSRLREEVEECAHYKDNSKKCKLMKKKVETMLAQWRRRKRNCLEFLDMMEEATDGTISTKKCISGDGQMDIDSDEAVIKGQIAYIKQKRSRKLMFGKRARPGPEGDNKKQKIADESFIGTSRCYHTYF